MPTSNVLYRTCPSCRIDYHRSEFWKRRRICIACRAKRPGTTFRKSLTERPSVEAPVRQHVPRGAYNAIGQQLRDAKTKRGCSICRTKDPSLTYHFTRYQTKNFLDAQSAKLATAQHPVACHRCYNRQWMRRHPEQTLRHRMERRLARQQEAA